MASGPRGGSETSRKPSEGQSAGWPRLTQRRVLLRKHPKFAAGVGLVLAVIFLIAALVEPLVGELKMQTVLIPVIF
jgi:hypothetical protein